MPEEFIPCHRGGAGPPLVLVHGFFDTWRVWELTLAALERRHEVLAVTLPGHAGGPPLPETIDDRTLADAVERAMERAGFPTAHLAGNSLGGFVALQLAQRGRARSVVAFAPAGGWASAQDGLLAAQARMHDQMVAAAPHADALVSSDAGRRQATRLTTTRYRHIPPALLAQQIVGGARCQAAPMLAHAAHARWELDPALIECPLRIVWGTADLLLPWPAAAVRLRGWFPHADWIELDGVGHCPQLDVPLEAAELILGVTAG